MLKVSTKGIYGMTAILGLALSYNNPQSIKQISEKTRVSEKYLEQIFIRLRKAGVVKSIRGPKGGYILAESPEKIPVTSVLRAVEGSLAPVDCVSCHNPASCERSEYCTTKMLWAKIRDGIYKVVDNISIKNLVDEYDLWIYNKSYMMNI